MNTNFLMIGAALLLTATTSGAGPTAVEILEPCASIEASAPRLACYDRLAGRDPAPPLLRPAEVAAMPDTPPSRTPAPPATEEAFGLTQVQQHLAPVGPVSIRARISSLNADRVGHASIALDNGQIWLVSDDTSHLNVGEAIAIRKAALGSYLMTAADNRAYSVRRTR